MRIFIIFIYLILPTCTMSQVEEEPTGCPWGCPTFIMRGSAILTVKEKNILDKIAVTLLHYPECSITVFNYSDTSAINKVLSFKRLTSVKNYLVSIKNIGPDRINTIEKMGESNKNVDIKTDCRFDSLQDKKTTDCPCDYNSIVFHDNEVILNSDEKNSLEISAIKLKSFPACNITVMSYSEASKKSQAICQKRSEMVKKFFVEKEGVSADRITTDCEVGGGDKNTIDLKCGYE